MGRRCGSDPAWLWLWHRWAATALTRPLAWEPPYAAGVALEKTTKKKRAQGDDSTSRAEPVRELLPTGWQHPHDLQPWEPTVSCAWEGRVSLVPAGSKDSRVALDLRVLQEHYLQQN